MLFVTFSASDCASIFCANLLLVAGDLIFKLADTLPRATQRVRLAVKAFVAMTSHAAPLVEKIASQVQRIGPLRDAILRVTLLAASLGVFLLKHWPEPEPVSPVALLFTRRRTSVTPVAARATKPIGSVYLQEFPVGMAHERTG